MPRFADFPGAGRRSGAVFRSAHVDGLESDPYQPEPAGRIADRHRHAAPAPAPGANLEQHVAFVDVAVVAPVVVEPSTEERAQPLRQHEVERAVAVGAPVVADEEGRLLLAVDPFTMRAGACRGKRRFRVRAGGDGAMVGG